MLIQSKDREALAKLLSLEQSQGNRYMTFPRGEASGFAVLNFHRTDLDAMEDNYEMATDKDAFGYMAIASLQKALSESPAGNSLWLGYNGVTDLSIAASQNKEHNKDQNLETIKSNNMNQENLNYLKNQVKYTGFGDSLEFQLQDNMEKGKPEFTLTHKPPFGDDKAEATLHFRQSDQGNYFFNRYDLALQRENAEPLKQSFYVGKDNTFTLKEAFNLMEGRSVNKEMVNREKETYQTWVKLDFSEADTNGNFKIKHYPDFDLSKKVAELPLKSFANDPDNKQLIESLQKGNRQAVTMEHNGTEHKRFLEVNAQFKTINTYDGSQRIKNPSQKQDKEPSENMAEGKSQSSGKTAKKNAGDQDEAPAAPAEKKRSRKAQGIS